MLQIRKPRKIGFFAMLLAVLGIGGCQNQAFEEVDEEISGITRLAYGSPSAHYSVKGKVGDNKGQALEGIEVRVQGRFQSDGNVYYRDLKQPTLTDGNGQWSSEIYHWPTDTLQIVFTDIDGAANGGEFAADSVRVATTIVKDPNNKSPWYLGDAKVDVPTVRLKKK